MSVESDARKARRAAGQAPVWRRGAALEDRLLLMALAAGFPAIVLALILLWTGAHSSQTRWTLTILLVAGWLGFSFALARKKYPHSSDSVQPAFCIEGGGLLFSRPEDPLRLRPGRGIRRGERTQRDITRSEAFIARSHGLAAKSDGRDRSGYLHFRRRATIEAFEPRRRASAGTAWGAYPGDDR